MTREEIEALIDTKIAEERAHIRAEIHTIWSNMNGTTLAEDLAGDLRRAFDE